MTDRQQRRSRYAVVTGGASGIGRGITDHFEKIGYKVFSLDVRKSECADPVRNAFEYACDVSSEQSIMSVADDIAAKAQQIDALICCAGIQISGGLEDTTAEAWDSVVDVNLGGVFFAAKAFLPSLQKSPSSSVLLISSPLAMANNSRGARVAYSASKAGVLGLNKSLAFDLSRYGIRVNCIIPGTVETDMLFSVWEKKYPELSRDDIGARIGAHQPLGRLGSPADIAAAAAFLVGESAGWITGAELLVDGGATTKLDLTPF